MSHRAMPIIVVCFCALGVCAEPTTQPATKLPDVRTMVVQLAEKDAARRQEARQALMGMARTDLPLLRQAIKKSFPLEPSQKAVLKDIVTQIYLAGDRYTSDESGFLGVRLPSWSRPEERSLLALERGVAVVSRIPGFCAFRMLQDGDVLLSIVGLPNSELNRPDDLISTVQSFKAGQKITFEVLRNGQIIKVPIILDRKPANAGRVGPESFDEFLNERMQRLEELWEKEFAPMLADSVG